VTAIPQAAVVQRRLAAALQGRLWRERVGLWATGIGYDRAHAERVAADAVANDPQTVLPRASFTTLARGDDAVLLWERVAGCFVDVVGWDVPRACDAARLIVDPVFDLNEGCR
jgi:hypothetical protein